LHVVLPHLSGALTPHSSNGTAARNGHAASATTRQIQGISADTWTALVRWGDETGNLKYWERGLAQSLANYALQRKQPTEKQTKHGLRIFKSAIASGFNPTT
jgi:hypothetical protein